MQEKNTIKESFFKTRKYYFKRAWKRYKWIIIISLPLFIFFSLQFGIQKSEDDSKKIFLDCFFYPLIAWFFLPSPLSLLLWGAIEEMGHKMKKDNTDLFFLSTEIPINRKVIFYKKLIFLVISFLLLNFFLFSFPIFVGWSRKEQWCFFSFFNFIVIPFLIFLPLTILLFSLSSYWFSFYNLLKTISKFMFLFLIVLALAIFQSSEILKKLEQAWESFEFFLKDKVNFLFFFILIAIIISFFALISFKKALLKYKKVDLL